MNKKDIFDNKVAVSPSVPLNCSADAPDRNAERKTPEQIALEIQAYFDIAGTPQQFERDKEFIAAKIRGAVEAEREACAKIAEQVDLQGDWDCAIPTVELEIRARSS